MAVRVKVQRLKLLAALEAVRDEAKEAHKVALRKFAADVLTARNRAAKELRKKADALVNDHRVYVASDTAWISGSERRRERNIPVLSVESSVKIPTPPEEHHALSSIERAIALLETSDDETVSVSTDDMQYYGIGSIAGLDRK